MVSITTRLSSEWKHSSKRNITNRITYTFYMGKLDTDSKALQQRIECNANSSEDFDLWVLDNLLLDDNIDVLELGCGTGKFSIPIAKRIFRGFAVGVDVSKESLDVAHRNAPWNFVPVEMDFDTLDLKHATFDRVLASYSIYYSKDIRGLVEKVHRMLKPGGVFFCCGPASGNNAEIKYLCDYSEEDVIENTMELAVPEMLHETFGNIEVFRFGNIIQFDSQEDMGAYWKASNLYDKEQEREFARNLSARSTFVNIKKIVGYRCFKNVG